MNQNAAAPTSAADHEEVALAIGLAGLRQFLLQPHDAQITQLLLLAGAFFWQARAEAGPDGQPIIVFQLEDKDGELHTCRCDLSAFALLMAIRILGQSVFINKTGARPYIKVFGRADEKAGIVFARLLLGAEEAEQVSYRNGNTLDLTFGNLALSGGRSKRGTIDWYALALGHIATLPDSLFAGTPEQKFDAAKGLLHLAVEGLPAELKAAA